MPQEVETEKARVHARDGSISYGQLKSFDAARGEFVLSSAEGERRLAKEAVQDIFLARDDASRRLGRLRPCRRGGRA